MVTLLLVYIIIYLDLCLACLIIIPNVTVACIIIYEKVIKFIKIGGTVLHHMIYLVYPSPDNRHGILPSPTLLQGIQNSMNTPTMMPHLLQLTILVSNKGATKEILSKTYWYLVFL